MYGAILRRFLVKAVANTNPGMQFGSGLGGGGCDLPHLGAAAFRDYAAVRRCCVGLLSVDLSAAFASMVREAVLPTSEGSEAWMKLLIDSGLDPEFAREVMAAVRAVCLWQDSGLSAHALQILEDFHTCTWFSISGYGGDDAWMRRGQSHCGSRLRCRRHSVGTSPAPALVCRGSSRPDQQCRRHWVFWA